MLLPAMRSAPNLRWTWLMRHPKARMMAHMLVHLPRVSRLPFYRTFRVCPAHGCQNVSATGFQAQRSLLFQLLILKDVGGISFFRGKIPEGFETPCHVKSKFRRLTQQKRF
eukprot:symbB.v1.2.030890.t1/scaffold3527.1/size54684/3